MLHFPSSLQTTAGGSGSSKRDTLNATQQKRASHPVLLQIENELHDARRVHSHGQEDDLRQALDMLIRRLTEVSALLAQTYRTQADLEVQLNVTQSNLKMVIANNEMLEEALRNNAGAGRDVGWRRAKPQEGESRQASLDQSQAPSRSASIDGEASPAPSPNPTPASESSSAASSPSLPAKSPNPAQQESRFFKFRFGSSSTNLTRTASRPETPNPPAAPVQHITSASLPVGAEANAVREKELENMLAELERRRAECEKERKARQETMRQKEALEAELESLSQALFEEANKMVASERIKAAETLEELREAMQEKEALRSALRLIERENRRLRDPEGATSDSGDDVASRSSTSLDTDKSTPPTSENGGIPSPLQFHSRSSSQIGMKSVPTSPTLRENRASVISMLHIPSEGRSSVEEGAAPTERVASPPQVEAPVPAAEGSNTPTLDTYLATAVSEGGPLAGSSAQTTPRLNEEGIAVPHTDAVDAQGTQAATGVPLPPSPPPAEEEVTAEEKAARRSLEVLRQIEPEASPWTAEESRWAAMATM
ncbi:hypothetical protein HDZ31DRAFT_66957 [Schizophyllum fasciatum]